MVLFGGFGILLILAFVVLFAIPLIGLLSVAALSLVFKSIIGVSLFSFAYGILLVGVFVIVSVAVASMLSGNPRFKALFAPIIILGTTVGVNFAFNNFWKAQALNLAYGDAFTQGITPVFTISNNIILAIVAGFIFFTIVILAVLSGNARPSIRRGPSGMAIVSSVLAVLLLTTVVFAAPSVFSKKGCFDGGANCETEVSVFRVDFPFEACNPLLSRDVDLSIGTPVPSKQSISNPSATEIEEVTLFIKVSDPDYSSGFVTKNLGNLGNNPLNNCEDGKIGVEVFGSLDGRARNYDYIAFTEEISGRRSDSVSGNFEVRG